VTNLSDFSLIIKKTFIPCLLLVLSTFAVFSSALSHQFLINWDDNQYLLQNPAVRGVTAEHLKAAFTHIYIGNYAPLHIISYMLDYELWGMKASGFIFTNILLHTGNGVLYYLLLTRLSGKTVWPLLAALLFLLHPMQVESVVWISQRKNLLAMFFFLAAFLFHVVSGENSPKEEWPDRFYLLSLAAFILAMLAKSVAITLPLVLVLFDFCYRQKREARELLAGKLPYLVITVILGSLAIMAQSNKFQGGRTSYYGGSPFATFLTMLPVLVSYLRLVFWPSGLSAWYQVEVRTGIDVAVAVSALLCALIIVGGAMLYRKRTDLFFWYALFFIGLLPVSQIIPIITLMNDRYLYFPMLGTAAFLGATLFGNMEWADMRRGKGILIPVALGVIGAYSAVSIHRVGVWQDSYTLWSDAVDKSPNAAVAHDCLGEALLNVKRDPDQAIEQFRIVLGLRRGNALHDLNGIHDYAQTYSNLGAAFDVKGMTEEAMEQFSTAISLNPMHAGAYFNMGNSLMHKGLVQQALRSFEIASRLNPDDPAFRANLAMTRQIINNRGISPVLQQ